MCDNLPHLICAAICYCADCIISDNDDDDDDIDGVVVRLHTLNDIGIEGRAHRMHFFLIR